MMAKMKVETGKYVLLDTSQLVHPNVALEFVYAA